MCLGGLSLAGRRRLEMNAHDTHVHDRSVCYSNTGLASRCSFPGIIEEVPLRHHIAHR